LKENYHRILKELVIDYEKVWGFFDKACQKALCMCGVGAICFFQSTHYMLLKYDSKQGTHNQVEFYALWILMQTMA
jgi:hypothetical protein